MIYTENNMPRKKKETVVKPAKVKEEQKNIEAAPPAPPISMPPSPPALTEAQKIWEEIRQVQLNMFSLPNQTVEMYCRNYPIEPTKVYMTIKVSAVLSALEDTLGKQYNFETAGKFVLVSRKY